jgi:hypothetical protein
MAEDGVRTRAAAYIDSQFRSEQHGWMREHQRQEQRMLAFHKSQLQSFANNRETAELRYVQRMQRMQRMQRIERGYQRAAVAVEKRHNSIAGRLERLTKAGRDKQEATREALDERRRKLDRMATANFRALGERQSRAEQAGRIARAREMKLFRQDHVDARRQQERMHQHNRPRQIEERSQTLQRAAAEQALKQGLQDLQQGRGRTITR